MMRVLVISPDGSLEDYLRRELETMEFAVAGTRPGADVVETARRQRPQIAVVDRVDTRREAAALELAVLRDVQADVRIILVSPRPSPEDAWLVERGVFFYLSASPPLRLPELVRAAAHAIREEADARTRQGELP